jgi:signal recognition particle subunit SRP54
MATSLSDKLSKLVKQFREKVCITETHVSDMLRGVRTALLEADVALAETGLSWLDVAST